MQKVLGEKSSKKTFADENVEERQSLKKSLKFWEREFEVKHGRKLTKVRSYF